VGLVGSTGRLGTAIRRLLADSKALRLGPCLVRDAERQAALQGLGLSANVDPRAFCAAAAVIVDCSAPACCAELLPLAAAQGVPYLLASTALPAAAQPAIERAAQTVAVFQAANLSRGVAVLAALVKQAAVALPHFDLAVSDLHHRSKRDAPSGTALALAAQAGPGRHVEYAALRGGSVVGEHTVFFLGEDERLELTHRSSSRDAFARGALAAAEFLLGAAPGLYGMADLLGVGASEA
jgi:4-hydroxy-tetrahydrodipicolinate reductase